MASAVARVYNGGLAADHTGLAMCWYERKLSTVLVYIITARQRLVFVTNTL